MQGSGAQKDVVVRQMWAMIQRRVTMQQSTNDPEWMIDLDPQKILRWDAENSNVIADIFRSPEEVEAMRQANSRAEAEAEARLNLEALGKSGLKPQESIAAGAI